jgi:putative ABC transport system permease protein
LNRGVAEEWEWSSYHPICFILAKPNTDVKILEHKFPAFIQKVEGAAMQKRQMQTSLSLEKLQDVYLYSTRNGNKNANSKNVYLFSFIAALVLLIACINFVNLTTARAAERAKEVGIRKVIGAGQFQLARQFAGESILFSLFAFFLSLVFSASLLPEFNQLAGKTISHGIFEQPSSVFYLFAATICIGLVAGFYPALVLSSFKPSLVLKGRFAAGARGNILRKSLVLVQFSLSTGFIIATIIVHHQLGFMRDQDLGFNKEQLMIINTEGDPARAAFQQSLQGVTGVISTSLASSVPGAETYNLDCEIENKKDELQSANLDSYFVDWNYIDQYKISMKAGRAFSRDFSSDTTEAMIINESAAKMFGYQTPEDAIGKRFKQIGREGKIIGVIKDFHIRSLQQPIKPLAMRIEPDACYLVSVKVSTKNLSSTLSAIGNKWRSIIPHRPLLYYFLDEFFDKQYRSEERFGKLFLYFTILAIFISCMGLFGLASYSTIQRTREIAVRKVLGASVQQIVQLLSENFLQLVIISFFVAAPVAGWFMHEWLTGFAYRTVIGWWDIVAAGLLTLTIALLTVIFQAVKAAIVSPVKSLRTE